MDRLLYSPEKFIWTLGLTLGMIILVVANTYIFFEGKSSPLKRLWILFQGSLLIWCVSQFLLVVAPKMGWIQLLIGFKVMSVITSAITWLLLTGLSTHAPRTLGFSGKASRRFKTTLGILYSALGLSALATFHWKLGLFFFMDLMSLSWLIISLIILELSFRYSHNDLMPVSVMPALASSESLILITDLTGRILYHNRPYLPGSKTPIDHLDTLNGLYHLLNVDMQFDPLETQGILPPTLARITQENTEFTYQLQCRALGGTPHRKHSQIIEITDLSPQYQLIQFLQEINLQLEMIHRQLNDYVVVADSLAAEEELDRIETELNRILGASYGAMLERLQIFRKSFESTQEIMKPEIIDETLDSLIEEIRSVIATLRASINHYSFKGGLVHDPGRHC